MSPRADRHDGYSTVPPHLGVRVDLDHPLACPVPAPHHDVVPERTRGHEGLGERGQRRTLCERASNRAGRTRWGWIVERCIQPQAGDRRDTAATPCVEEQQSREAAVTNQHQVAARQPATGLEDELASDVEQRFVVGPARCNKTICS